MNHKHGLLMRYHVEDSENGIRFLWIFSETFEDLKRLAQQQKEKDPSFKVVSVDLIEPLSDADRNEFMNSLGITNY